MLERFRKAPIHNPDPAVRAPALLELPLDDPQFLEALSQDTDASVRAQLIGKLTDPLLVDERRRKDEAGAVVEAARARLRALLGDSPDCDAATRASFVGASDDADVLFYAALHAPQVEIRKTAFERHARCSDDHELLRVAVASRETDSKLREEATEGLDDEALLERVVAATRKSDKVTHRFARERLKALREAIAASAEADELATDLAARAQQPVAATSEALHMAVALQQQWQERWMALAKVEGLVLPDTGAAQASLDEKLAAARAVIQARAQLLDDTDGATVETNEQLEALRERWNALPDHLPRETTQFESKLAACAKRLKALDSLAERQAQAADLLERFEQQEERAGAAAALEKSWKALALDEQDAAVAPLFERYTALLTKLNARDKHSAEAIERATAQATQMIEQLEQALEQGQIAPATSACDKLTHRLRMKKNLPPAVVARLDKRLAVLAPKLQEMKQARVWSTQQAREELIVEVEALAALADASDPKGLDEKIRGLRSKWRELDHGVGPAHEDTWKRFNSACVTANEPAKEFFKREAAQRRVNAAAMREICERVEAYAAEVNWDAPDWESAASFVNASRKAFREVGLVGHQNLRKLRPRFDAAIKPIETQLENESEREVRRRTLAIAALEACIKNEPLEKQIDLAKRTQRDWRPTVRARPRQEQQMWDALRKLCDGIFGQRDEKFASRKEAETAALSERQAVCAELEALASANATTVDNETIKAVTAQYSALKDRWREAGEVHPGKRNAIAGRYRDACKKLDGLRDDVKRRQRARQTETMLERLRLVDQRWRAIAAGASAEVSDEPWSALGEARGAMPKKLVKAFNSAPPSGPQIDERAALCLRAELTADVPSPPEQSAARMALKVEQLKNAMAGTSALAPGEAVNEFIELWLQAPLTGTAADEATFERFAVALDALVHRR